MKPLSSSQEETESSCRQEVLKEDDADARGLDNGAGYTISSMYILGVVCFSEGKFYGP